ncbi:MAG: cellulose biosynthesis cyclic di-GMP-binding regulatory protein BcsB [Chloroflexi bacterium]|nr:cellulose biosynthesis cyclic di-GMP-binding regulatory protein BcsB [Chloroflexota bacterium]
MQPKRTIHALLVIAIFSTLLIGAVQPQASGGAEKLTLSLSDLGYVKDETLVGINVDRIYGFRWPESWKPEPGNRVNILFSHSRSLDSSSSLVVDWNGTRLNSTQLDTSNINRGSLTVEIPESLIQPGYNELRLEFYMGMHSDDFCQDINNPNIWATVHSDSKFVLSYSTLQPELNLSRFPYPFVDSSDLIENSVVLLVPDQPTDAELTAVATVSAKLGQEASYRVLNLNTASASSLGSVTGNLIYIGLADRLPVLQTMNVPFAAGEAGAVRLTDLNGQNLPEGAGVLWEQTNPADANSVVLVVTGKDDAGLLKAARGLANELAHPRISGPFGVILEVPDPEIGQGPAGQALTFKQLGYEDASARGVREQTLNFVIPLSLAWQIQSEIHLDLHFAHSTLVDDQRSSLNISLNGSPVSNILLTKDNATDAWANFRLPARMFRIGNNHLTIKSTINLMEGYTAAPRGECGENYEEEAWAAVYSDSYVTLPPAPSGMNLTLADFPMAYIGDPSMAELAFIVPDQPDVTIAGAVAQISARLGRYTRGVALAPTVLKAQDALANAPSQPYQILIGIPAEHAMIQKLNDELPAPFQAAPRGDVNVNQLKPNDRLPRIVSLDGTTGYVEVLQNDRSYPRLIVAGTNPEGLSWAAGAVSLPEMMGGLKGDVAILDSAETMVTAQVRDIEEPGLVLGAATAVEDESQPMPWVLWATYLFIGLTVLIFLVIWISEIIRRKVAKEHYEAHS